MLNGSFSDINKHTELKKNNPLINKWNHRKQHCPEQNMIPHNKIEFIYIVTLLVNTSSEKNDRTLLIPMLCFFLSKMLKHISNAIFMVQIQNATEFMGQKIMQ